MGTLRNHQHSNKKIIIKISTSRNPVESSKETNINKKYSRIVSLHLFWSRLKILFISGNDVSSVKHTVIVSTNLNMAEHGELISRYRDDVDKAGVLLVKEVDSVPSDLAMAFHYYCDEYNPLVKRSAIFFTLDLANCSNVPGKNDFFLLLFFNITYKWNSLKL